MEKNSKIYIAGDRGLVGSAIVKNLETKGYEGELYLNDIKPDGTMVTLTDPSKLHVELEAGLRCLKGLKCIK